MRLAIGIDLGGTQIKCLAWDRDADTELDRRVEPTRDGERIGDDPAWAATIRDVIRTWSETYAAAPSAVGISAPGLPAEDGRSIRFMPGRMQGLEGLDWTEFLGLETTVPVLNDAQAALLGEIWQGAVKGCRNVILLTLGTGVGGAIVCDGHLLRGQIGRAGHLGHLCLDPYGKPGITGVPGTLEDAIGNSTISERSEGRFTSTRDLLDACAKGDAEAVAVWRRSVRALACAIASLANAVDPEAVVLGGGIAEAGELLFDPLREELDAVEWRPGGHRVQLRKAEVGDWAGAFGAAYRAIDQIRDR